MDYNIARQIREARFRLSEDRRLLEQMQALSPAATLSAAQSPPHLNAPATDTADADPLKLEEVALEEARKALQQQQAMRSAWNPAGRSNFLPPPKAASCPAIIASQPTHYVSCWVEPTTLFHMPSIVGLCGEDGGDGTISPRMSAAKVVVLPEQEKKSPADEGGDDDAATPSVIDDVMNIANRVLGRSLEAAGVKTEQVVEPPEEAVAEDDIRYPDEDAELISDEEADEDIDFDLTLSLPATPQRLARGPAEVTATTSPLAATRMEPVHDTATLNAEIPSPTFNDENAPVFEAQPPPRQSPPAGDSSCAKTPVTDDPPMASAARVRSRADCAIAAAAAESRLFRARQQQQQQQVAPPAARPSASQPTTSTTPTTTTTTTTTSQGSRRRPTPTSARLALQTAVVEHARSQHRQPRAHARPASSATTHQRRQPLATRSQNSASTSSTPKTPSVPAVQCVPRRFSSPHALAPPKPPEHILDLPDEVLLHVFKMLPAASVCHLAQTCQRLAVLCRDPSLFHQGIRIKNKQLSSAAFEALVQRQPRKLVLAQCRADNASCFRDVLEAAGPRMKLLALPSCSFVTDNTVRSIAKLCRELTTLDLTWASITSKSLQYLAHAPLARLTSVSLSNCATISDRGLALFLLSKGRQLQSLDLSGCMALTANSVATVAMGCSQLKELSLAHNNKLTKAALQLLLTQLEGTLVSLDMSGCKQVTDEWVSRVMVVCGHLRALNLAGCSGLTEAGMRDMARIFPSLETLNISGCTRLSADGLASVFADGFGSLRSLNLAGVATDDTTFAAVQHHCPRIEELVATGSNASTAAVEDFVARSACLKRIVLAKCANVDISVLQPKIAHRMIDVVIHL